MDSESEDVYVPGRKKKVMFSSDSEPEPKPRPPASSKSKPKSVITSKQFPKVDEPNITERSVVATKNKNQKQLVTPSTTPGRDKLRKEEKTAAQATTLTPNHNNTVAVVVEANEEHLTYFSALTKVYEQVGNIKGQNSKMQQRNLLRQLFRKMCERGEQDLIRAYYLSIMKTGPDYCTSQLGVGKEILTKAIAKSCGKSEKQVRDNFQTIGDMGEVAEKAKTTQKTMDNFFTKKKAPTPLTIKFVFESFAKISQCKGNNSSSEREGLILKLLMDSKNEETKFIVRWIEGNLKISAGQKTMQQALIQALYENAYSNAKRTEQGYLEYERAVKRAMAEYPDEGTVISTLLKAGQNLDYLRDRCKITPGIPCKPMLAKPTKAISSILTRFENKRFTCEFKYDGLRGQIHYFNKTIKIFSRNLESLTEAYPDIVDVFESNLKTMDIDNFIIDSQIVAIDKKTKKILPFQVLSTRSKKVARKEDVEVAVSVYAFDILYLNGPVTHLNLEQRRKLLKQLQPSFSEIISLISSKECESLQEIDEFLQEAIKAGTEGLMIKDMSSEYSCAKRSWDWVKLKKDYIDGLGDTLDLVPIGGNFGTGKRKGLYGAYLLAVFNPDLEVYQTICKIGTGFSDEMLQAAHKFFADKVVINKPREYLVSSDTEAEVWFTPSVVWEVKGADFQLSPIYTCGKGTVDDQRGIGLRFPRLLKVRSDKKPTDSSNTDFVIDLYRQQAVVQNKGAKNMEEQDDYY